MILPEYSHHSKFNKAEQDQSKIPGRENYTLRYLACGRMFSYAHQLHSTLSFGPAHVLEVGVGAGIVAAALRAAGIRVTTIDIQPELEPDIVGTVTAIDCPDGSFDVGICCQVLEHLPYEQFEPALRELRRVTTDGIVLSLPDASRYGYFSTKLPFIPKLQWEWEFPRTLRSPMPKRNFEVSGHYWEIGYHGFPCRRILESIRNAGWENEMTWRVPEFKWHRFFKLKHVKG